MKVIVTGGAGFIGSAVIRHLVADTGWQVVNLDKLTYAGKLESLGAAAASPRYKFHQADICDRATMARILSEEQPDAIMHLAAESHVDRSIDGPSAFVETNIVVTYILLEECARYVSGLSTDRTARFRFHHISTDEVFGSLGPEGSFHEDSPYGKSLLLIASEEL
jgi:dTDP-glucose 4,6-dehydratase